MGALTTTSTNPVRGALERADAVLLGLRDQLTPGQRWTAALAGGLACSLLLFGQPAQFVSIPASTAPPADPAPVAAAPPTSQAPTSTPPVGQPVDIAQPPPTGNSAPRPLPPPVGNSSDQPDQPESATDVPTGPTLAPTFTALVPTSSNPAVPGRDEATIAATFLDNSTVNAVVTTYDPGAEDFTDVCETASQRPALLSASALPPALLDCVVGNEIQVLSHDDRLGTSHGSLSTRDGIAETLLAATEWGRPGDGGALADPVGLAIEPRFADEVAAVRPALEAAGLEIAAVIEVTDVPSAVAAFAQSGATTAVFAIPATQQRQWLAVAGPAAASWSYVVLDTGDSVTSSSPYAPAFDGASYFGTALPTHEPTEAQTACLTRYGSDPLTDDERTAVLRWCQLSGLADLAAARIRTDGTPLLAALRALTYQSPVTTPLTSDEDSVWRPETRRELVWQLACTCWTEPTAQSRSAPTRRVADLTPGPGSAR